MGVSKTFSFCQRVLRAGRFLSVTLGVSWDETGTVCFVCGGERLSRVISCADWWYRCARTAAGEPLRDGARCARSQPPWCTTSSARTAVR